MKDLKKYFLETGIPFLIWLAVIIFALGLEFSGYNKPAKHKPSSCSHTKIVSLVGASHVNSLQRQLTTKKLGSVSIVLDGGEFFYNTLVTEAARHSNLQSKRLIVKTALPGCDGDYHLHIPQVDQAYVIPKRN